MKKHGPETSLHPIPSDILIYPFGASTLHASLLKRVSRGSIPRHWLAQEGAPLVFRCSALDTSFSGNDILIAAIKMETVSRLGVIEHADRKTYIFCPLDMQLTHSNMIQLLETIEIDKKNMEKKSNRSIPTTPISTTTMGTELPNPISSLSEIPALLSPTLSETQMTFDNEKISISNTLNHLKQQYFEILYISKVTLAYFVKTTLTKARTQFQQILGENQAPFEIVKFIETSLLRTPEELETKFKKWLPILVQPLLEGTTLHEWPSSVSDWKIDAIEQSFIMRWCTCNEEECTLWHAEAMNKKIDTLKIREFQLQIILVLEVLSQHREMKNHLLDEQKKEKLHCLSSINQYLDILIDRLCIWQALDDSHFDLKPDSDQLRLFCTEVVMPFYGPKLLDVCKALYIKCGGPIPSHHSRLKGSRKKTNHSFVQNVAKPLHSTFSLATALTDEKTKSARTSTFRHLSLDLSTKGILTSLQHREIKIPHIKPGIRKQEDATSHATSHTMSHTTSHPSSSMASHQTHGKQTQVNVGNVQVLATPKQNRT